MSGDGRVVGRSRERTASVASQVGGRARLGRAVLLTPEQGAEPLLHLAAIADTRTVNGAYFHRLTREEPRNEQARDPQLARRLWERSAELTGLEASPPRA